MMTLFADYRGKRLFKLILYVLTLFIINNILFARLNSYYLGGSITGAITLMFITFLVLTVRHRAVVPFVYAVYGSLAVPSHFYVGDYMYIFHITYIVGCAFVYDRIIYGQNFSMKGIIAGFPVFVLMLRVVDVSLNVLLHGHQINMVMEAQGFTKSLLLGYTGVVLGWCVFFIRNRIKSKPSIRESQAIEHLI